MFYTLILILNLFIPQTLNRATSSKGDTVSIKIPKSTNADTDISGYWEGTISRDEGYGKRVMFEIEVILMQKGKACGEPRR